MRLRSPFEWITVSALKPALVLSILATLALMVTLNALGAPLRTEAAPAGIVSFEFAGSLVAARRMIESWGGSGRIYAGLNLGLDYLFLIAYPLSIGLACVMVSRRLRARGGGFLNLGILLAWGQGAAGSLDALENYSLIRVLLGTQIEAWPTIARLSATGKFALVTLGLLFILAALVAAGIGRGPARRGPADSG